MHPPKKPLIFIVGPTAVGKTEISLHLGKIFSVEIISADSRLLYLGMDIGTAKPTISERETIPHHLIDVAKPDDVWSLAAYQTEVHKTIQEIYHRGNMPMIVGGTGQYIRAIIEGWDIPQAAPDLSLRNAIENWGKQILPEGLHKRLSILDPEAAKRIDPPNIRRTIRALEVIFTTGKLFSIQRQRKSNAYNYLMLGLNMPRTDLYNRIDKRIDLMFQKGLVAEVNDLIQQGYTTDQPTMTAIGYREVIAYIQGQMSFDAAVSQMKKKSRQYVRRQANWFKPDDPNIHWFQAGQEAKNLMTQEIRCWLKANGIQGYEYAR